jgi:hypothetical protein
MVWVTAVVSCLPGCSLLHHGESPQQQFVDALQRGNGPQASSIWLHMSADNRANLAHDVGFKPQVSPDDVKAQLLQHEHDAEALNGSTVVSEGGQQTIEAPGLAAVRDSGLSALSTFSSSRDAVAPAPQEGP